MWAKISWVVLLPVQLGSLMSAVSWLWMASLIHLADGWLLAGDMGLTEPCIHASIIQQANPGSFT